MDLIAALRAFTRVTETGSFSAVARETHVSQSAVTRLVAQLEQHFEVRLFHRTTRRLSLTDDGQVLLAHARHLLESADEMETVLGRQSGAPRGLVRLGTSVAGGLFLATRLPVLLARHPGLSVELVMRDQPSDMIEERLDLAFRSGRSPMPRWWRGERAFWGVPSSRHRSISSGMARPRSQPTSRRIPA